MPLCVTYSTETWAVLESLQQCQIDYRDIEVLKRIYRVASLLVIRRIQLGWSALDSTIRV